MAKWNGVTELDDGLDESVIVRGLGFATRA
jgi:hypothetical protein